MIDNFFLMKDFLIFPENSFYFLQIIKRKKDNPEMKKEHRIVKTFYIKSIEQLFECKEEIIDICSKFNARAYIAINPSDFEKVSLLTLSKISSRIIEGHHHLVKDCYNSACGEFTSSIERRWLIDFDSDDGYLYTQIVYFLSNISKTSQTIIQTFKTKSGMHIVTNKFDSSMFNFLFSVDIHKNNPTLLYAT